MEVVTAHLGAELSTGARSTQCAADEATGPRGLSPIGTESQISVHSVILSSVVIKCMINSPFLCIFRGFLKPPGTFTNDSSTMGF